MQTLHFLVGAICLLAGNERALYRIATGCIIIFIFSMPNAWVLLVEILR